MIKATFSHQRPAAEPVAGGWRWRLPANLRWRLSLAIGGLGLVTALSLALVVGHFTRLQIESDQRRLLTTSAQNMSARLMHDLDTHATQLQMLAAMAVLREAAVPAERKRALLEAAQRALPALEWIGLTDRQGRVLASTGGLLTGQMANHRPWFGQGLKGLHFGEAHKAVMLDKLLPPQAPELGPRRLVDIALPVLDEQGQTLGVLSAHLSLAWANRLQQQLLQGLADTGLNLLVLSGDGQPLVGQWPTLANGVPFDGWLGGMAPGETRAASQIDADGQRMFSVAVNDKAYAHFPGMGWRVVARVTEASAFAPARQLALLILALGLVAVVFFASVMWVILGRHLRPLEAISQTARRIQAGEPEVRVPVLPGRGEVAVFARSLAELVNDLQDRNLALRLTSRVFDESQQAIALCDARGRLLVANPAFPRLTGIAAAQLPGQQLPDMLVDQLPEATRRAIAQSLRDTGRWRGALACRQPDGSAYIADADVLVLREADGQVSHHIVLLEDVTDRLRVAAELEQHRDHLESLLQARTAELRQANTELDAARQLADRASQAKSDFMANMSHEIRTPLNAIVGLAHQLGRDAATERQRTQLGQVRTAASHLLAIVDDVLDFAKIEAGKLQLDHSDFSVAELVARVMAMVEAQATAKGLALRTELPAALPDLLHGDERRLGQVLLNFAGNAVKFTRQGEVLLRAQLLRQDGPTTWLRLAVHDTGVGLSAEQQSRLFRPFEQADASTTRQHGGSGLGLAISQRLAALMGGQVGVRSTLGAGAVFWVDLPLAEARHSDPARVPAGASPGPVEESLARLRALGPRRVLLAEDNPVNQEVALALLGQAGLRVEVAEDGLQAVDLAARQAPDLILMDMQMPQMDGLQATRAIRRLPQGQAVPIVAMTANAFDDAAQQCREAGMDDHIAKPVEPATLYATLLRWLAPAGDRGGRPDRA